MSTIGEYIHNQKGIFQTSLIKIIKSSKLNPYPNKGEYTFNWIIDFKDESIFQSMETLIIKNNKLA